VKSDLFGKGLRYRVRYIGPDGRPHNKSFPDRAKRDAEAFMVSVEADKLRGSYIDPAAGRMTFGEFAEEWLRTHSFDESTRESTEYRVRKHLLPFFGARQLASIKPGHIREWDRAMVGTLAVSTRSVVFAHLRTILAAAVDDERIAKNPCSARSVKQPRPAQRRVVPWKLPEVSAIRAGLAERYRPVVDLGAGCGMRQGEIFGFGVDGLDLDGGWLHVTRQLKLVRSRLVFGLPKNDRPRRVPLPDTVAEVLRRHMETYSPVTVALPWEDPTSDELVSVDLVLTSTRRGAINRAVFDRKSWRPALIKAGIVPTRATGMHALRHFYASALLDAGESIKALAEYLGHSDPAFTLRVYTHLMPASEKRARRAIDDLFGGPDVLATS
jgi:integrase